MPHLAIVGAGAAGLAAAHALRDAPLAVTVFEKSRGLAGRAATRWRDAEDAAGAPFRWRYDHGAQYLSAPVGSPSHRLVTEGLDADGLAEITRPGTAAVWPFGADGAVRPGDARPEGAPRLTYADGIASLGRRLADATPGLDVRTQTRVGRVEQRAAGWRVEGDDGADLGAFDAVLLTAPAPQAVVLVRESAMGDALRERLLAGLGEATYRSQFTVVWAFPEGLAARPAPYALVDTSGEHAAAWIAVESDKPGRAPAGATLLLAQMSAAWTAAHYDAPKPDVVAAATEAVGGVVGALPPAAWTDTQRWRYALPDAQADAAALRAAEAAGVFVAGDAVAGKGRVHLALETGMDAAARIRAHLQV